MQWPSLTHTLALPRAFVLCTWMKFSALAARLISLTAPKALLSAVLMSNHMQEYDVKVWGNDKIVLYFHFILEYNREILLSTTCVLIFTVNASGNCNYGDIRLVGGSNQYEGRVEVCINDQWGTVCQDSWSSVDASVICKQLGYATTGSECNAHCYQHFYLNLIILLWHRWYSIL